MIAPPKYPRIPHLAPSVSASSDDLVLPTDARAELLQTEVVVEEKLDGMNVMLWVERGTPRVGTRGGVGTSDRSGERGRISAWASGHADALVAGLGERYALYGEWLRRRHGIAYERLPAELIGFDVFDRGEARFLVVDDRNALLARMAITGAPQVFRGRLGSRKRLEQLFGRSAFADEPAEGLILRAAVGDPRRIAKFIDPMWRGIGSSRWVGENRLAAGTV